MKIVTALIFLAASPAWADGPAQLASEMEGVYKHRFRNAFEPTAEGVVERYMSEDVVEVVRYDDSSVYVRAKLDYANGHTCDISGIARFDPARNAFVYRTRTYVTPTEPDCELAVAVTEKELKLDDWDAATHATCSHYCGARGSLHYSIARSGKRKIRYMERLLASPQYHAAVEEANK